MKDFTLEELKSAKPFLQNINGENKWIAPAYYMSNGVIGGYIFNEEKDAELELKLIIGRIESKIKQEAEESARKQKEAETENELIKSYKGFLSNNPMKAGKQRATLEKTSWFPKVNRMVTKKEFVEIISNEGFTPNIRPKMKKVHGGYLEKDGDKTEYVLTKDGSSYVVNKTEWEYAEFLTEEKTNG